MGILLEFFELKIQSLENENLIMKSLIEDFKKVVLIEYRNVNSLELAYDNIEILYREHFGVFRYSSYNQFLKTL